MKQDQSPFGDTAWLKKGKGKSQMTTKPQPPAGRNRKFFRTPDGTGVTAVTLDGGARLYRPFSVDWTMNAVDKSKPPRTAPTSKRKSQSSYWDTSDSLLDGMELLVRTPTDPAA
jgi:hypothetical protein